MLKKITALAFVLSLTACSSESNLSQPSLIDQQSQVSANAAEKNSLFGYSVNTGEASFVFNKQNSMEQEISTTPSISIDVKKLGVKLQAFNMVNLSMPDVELRGYTRIANNGNLYVEDYGKDKFYKVGTWTKKDKFKGKGYIDLKDTKYKLFSQDFTVKLDSSVKKISALLPLNPMADKVLSFEISDVIKPVSKTTLNFDLAKFIVNK